MTKEVPSVEPIIGRDKLPPEIRISKAEEAKYADRWGISVERLPGGTMAVAINRPVHDLQEVDLGLVLRVGPHDDPKGLEGLTHLGEHLVFGGCSEARDTREQYRRFRYNGYEIDGTTYPLDVWFNVEAGSGQNFGDFGVEPAVRNLASMITTAVLDERRFEQERRLIIDEYWGNLRDFWRQSYRFVCDSIFPDGHPLRKIITGDEDSLGKMTLDELKRHLARHFTFANADIRLLSHGNPDKHDRVKQLLRDVWGEFSQPGGRSHKRLNFADLKRYHPLDASQEYTRRLDTRRGRVWIGTASAGEVELYSRQSLALDLALELLRTEVFAQLRGEGGYGYQPELVCNWVPYTGVGMVRMGIEVEKERAGELRQKIKKMFSEMIRGAIGENLAARKVDSERKRVVDTPIRYRDRLNMAFSGLRSWGQIIRVEDVRRLTLEVTADDINEWLEKLADDPGAVFVLGDI